MRAFGFDEADLEANQHGELSPRQREHLDNLWQSRRRWGIYTLAVIFGMQGVAFILVLITGNLNLEELRQGGPIVLLIYAFLTIIGLISSHRHNNRMKAGKVEIAEGQARLHTGQARYGTFYQLRLKWKRFDLMNEKQFDAFEAGAAYRVYYVNITPALILSVEAL